MSLSSIITTLWVAILIALAVLIPLEGFFPHSEMANTIIAAIGPFAYNSTPVAKILAFCALPLAHSESSTNQGRFNTAMSACFSICFALTVLANGIESANILQACANTRGGCPFLPSANMDASGLLNFAIGLLPMVMIAIQSAVFAAIMPLFIYGWLLLALDLWNIHMNGGDPAGHDPAPDHDPAPVILKAANLQSSSPQASFGRRRS